MTYTHLSYLYILRYDNRAKDLTKEGMRRGIQQAVAFMVSNSLSVAISLGPCMVILTPVVPLSPTLSPLASKPPALPLGGCLRATILPV
jgi:hypothetical protein